VNSKNCIVEIEFNTNNKAYKVVRGIKPAVFEIWCDGTCLNKDSASKDYQEHLEKFILKMTYKSFTQIVLLGSASFTPFMQLKPADRRAVIEDLLDIQVFSVMNELVRGRLQINKEDLEKNRIAIIGKEEKKAFVERTLSSLKKSNQDKLTEMEASVKEFEFKIDSVEKELKNYTNLINDHNKITINKNKLLSKHNKLLVLKTKIQGNYDRKKQDMDFFHDHDTCPTCRQGISEHARVDEAKKIEGELIVLQAGITGIETSIKDTLTQIKELEKEELEINKTKDVISEKTVQIQVLQNKLEETQKAISIIQNSDKLVQDNETELSNTKSELDTLLKEKERLLKDKLFIDTAINLLKDGGIKTKIVLQYIPIINKLINKYLAQMGAFIDFNINESFEETIKARYREDFSYHNFSEGEKMRIDLSILFTWREIAKMRNSINTNLLIFDEIFDRSLDANGTDDFLKIMWNLAKDTNVLVISHKQDQLVDKFQKVYRVKKKQNFSEVVTS
jgi:DNA repair exonuclease SbcCD ATPase subunit